MRRERVIGCLFALGFWGCSVGGDETEPAAMKSVDEVGSVVSAIRASAETESELGIFSWEVRRQSHNAADGNSVAVVGFDRKGWTVFNQTIETAAAGSQKSVTVEVTVPAAYKYEIGTSGDRRDLVPAADPKIISMLARFASDMDSNKPDTSDYDACAQAAEYALYCAAAAAACTPATAIACPLVGYYCAYYGNCQVACFYGDASC